MCGGAAVSAGMASVQGGRPVQILDPNRVRGAGGWRGRGGGEGGGRVYGSAGHPPGSPEEGGGGYPNKHYLKMNPMTR